MENGWYMMKNKCFERLVILEMANNHMGDVAHGIALIRALAAATAGRNFRFAVKFQYRDLDTLIHPDYRDRMDIKYIKRFSETRLSEEDFLTLKREVEACGFIPLCTPFDEKSVDRVVKHGYGMIKIASCSFNDWPLLEKIAQTGKPVIASTAGAALEDIDNVVCFFEHRNIPICLMHCVGSYPTPAADLEMNQIDFFRKRYPDISVGFSTHEDPADFTPVVIAVAKGAEVLERHVGLPTEKYSLNAYSSTPEQVAKWLDAAEAAYTMCGKVGVRRDISQKERGDLRGLQRGLFAAKPIAKGEKVGSDALFFAMPNQPGQFIANEFSKYRDFVATADIPALAALTADNVSVCDNRARVRGIVAKLCKLIRDSGIQLQDKLDLELSHHYGLERFDEVGCSIITCVNREYCKKIIMLLPGQYNPVHTHYKKEETFHILYGELTITLDGVKKVCRAGDIVVVERGKAHDFGSATGAVLEEISTTHYKNDSFYEDKNIAETSKRKTYMTFYRSWLDGEIE